MMKLGLGLYRDLLDAENLRFARQAGATHIVAHIPGQFAGSGRRQIITSDRTGEGFGVSDPDDPIWTYEGLAQLKRLVESEGLVLEALENFAPAHWYDVLLDGPLFDAQIARLQQLIRDMGRLGIATIGYNFSVAGVWGRSAAPVARGAARSVGFHDPPQPPIRAGMVWNMVYDPEHFDPDARPTIAPVSHAQIWDRYRRFLAAMLPVAEAAGVRLALHPDDPPLPALRGAARLIHSPDGFAEVLAESPSPMHTMEFCIGTLSEMPGGDIYQMVDRYSRTGRIAYVHFRNVRGRAPHHDEMFVDDGDTDMLEVLRILHRNRFDGVLIPDHTPQLQCAAPWHAGMAYALGYLRAALQLIARNG
jgi:mannonate dehydratase